MLTITVTSRALDGADIAGANLGGRTVRAVSRRGATMALARRLVAAGCADQPWQAVGVDGRLRFHGPSLHRLAGLTIREDDRVGPLLEAYRPYSGAPDAAVSRSPERGTAVPPDAVVGFHGESVEAGFAAAAV